MQIVLDLEFTAVAGEAYRAGLRSEVIEIGAVRLDSKGCTADTFSCFVKPDYAESISKKVMALTDIRMSDVSDAPCFAEALGAFADWVGECSTRMVAWSKADRMQIVSECAFKGLEVPSQMKRCLPRDRKGGDAEFERRCGVFCAR